MNNTPKIEIVVPVYNEASNISALTDLLHLNLKNITDQYQILFVDDGSKDDSWKMIKNVSEKFSEVKGIRFYRNFGKEAAIRAGLENTTAEVVIVIDADLQHPPELIPQMYQHWKDNNALIVEAQKVSEKRNSLIKQTGAKFAYGFLKITTGLNLDGKSDYKLLDRKVVDYLSELPESKRFFRGLVDWLGIPATTIEFQVPNRQEGTSGFSLARLISLSIDMITSFTTLPLRFVTFCSALFIIFSILLGIQTLFLYFTGGAVEGFTTVIISILLVGGILAGALGIIGEYLARIHEELKQRPAYLVKEKI